MFGSATPFRHITLDWNPDGHEPPGVYDLPHFDFHFYTIPNEVRLTMTPDHPGFEEKGNRVPEGDHAPEGFMVVPGGAVPLMGTHWIEPTAPELNGAKFTETFLYGSWDGEIVFIEPMVTIEWLNGRPNHTEPITLPKKLPSAGLWPTQWSVRYDAAEKAYVVELGALVRR